MIREKLAGSTDATDRPLLDLTWDYPTEGAAGRARAPRPCWPRSTARTPTASRCRPTPSSRTTARTACGCWIYCGVYADGVNQAARRKPGSEQSWVAPEWGWAWPANRRILYNRASADPDGRPWSERKAYVWWDAEQGKWTGHDVPDFDADQAAGLRAARGRHRRGRDRRRRPVHHAGRRQGWLYAPAGLADGPLPAHYEPQESPVRNPLYGAAAQPGPADRSAPARTRYHRRREPGADVFPYVFTTYRLTEHHTAGGMSRWLPYLSELQPEFFCEVSPRAGRRARAWSTAAGRRSSPRATRDRGAGAGHRADAAAAGRRAGASTRSGCPTTGARNGLSTGDAANELLPSSLDPNVHIQETKAAACDIRPGRRPRGPACVALVAEYRAAGGHHRPQPDGGRPTDVAAEPAAEPAAADGVLHRHLGVHRLQGLRGGVQGVERGPRGRARPSPACRYDNTGGAGRRTWRHVAFIEQARDRRSPGAPDLGSQRDRARPQDGSRWLMSSDVCKHCTHAACLDVCPTGALFRTEFGTVVVQEDICNGCGYCVPACPYGVIDRREDDGRAWKCTLCYDRLGAGWSRPARRPARPSRSSSGRWTSCASGPGAGRRRCTRPASTRPGSTATTRTTGSAATARSSCCSTSPRSTGCRRTRSSPPATCRRCGARAAAAAGRRVAARGGARRSWGRASGGERRGEQPMVPDAEFRSYYGRPILKAPTWKAPDVAGYLFLGGLAGASSVLAAARRTLTGRPRPGPRRPSRRGRRGWPALARWSHDLGRPDALPQHAAGVQADLAAERRHLAARRRTPRCARRGRGVRA